MAHSDCLKTSGNTSPRHDCCIWSNLSFKDFVPSDDSLALVVYDFLHSGDNVCLKEMFRLIFIVCLESEFANLSLATRTFLPTNFRTLVTTNVDIFRREEIADLRKHVLKELHGLFFTCAENIIRNAPISPDIIWPTCTSKFRICR